MRILLSTIGSRGDVQPLVALAMQLRALDQDVRFCVPPDFQDWIGGLGFPVVPIGPELRKAMAAAPASGPPAAPSPERRRQLADATVAVQFVTLAAAARGCDLIVAAAALQIAARSVAERLRIGYVFAAYCPAVLPSPHHPPPVLPGVPGQSAAADGNRVLWERDAERFADAFGAALNSHRAAMGLAPVDDVRGHVFTDCPILAADPVLAPWPEPESRAVTQTGAWVFTDERPLDRHLSAFLDAGDAPVYFGLGSMRAPRNLALVMLQAARAAGRRAIVSRGWGGLSVEDAGTDWLSIDDVPHAALFERVAAVVHHGGAGTTTTAALAAVPQVVIPQFYDQPYWADRVQQLDIGYAHATGLPTTDSLATALDAVLQRAVAAKASDVASVMRRDGARDAAVRLVREAFRES